MSPLTIGIVVFLILLLVVIIIVILWTKDKYYNCPYYIKSPHLPKEAGGCSVSDGSYGGICTYRGEYIGCNRYSNNKFGIH